ncbi:MAG: complex I NDUFA9 subunit family protein [Alphaproteobacteria bacterium]|nr:complex I NDUFA9 subunit family protein [Alphaproteobacteria bacterium]
MTLGMVTVFGGSGFVGRNLVRLLAREGAGVRVAVRDPEEALFLKPCGDVGQVTPVQGNLRSDESVRAAIHGADAVVNLVGILYQSRRQTFEAVHHEGAARVARIAAEEGVSRYVHMSAIGASESSPAQYARTKAKGEQAVRQAFPTASIVRPSIIFGPDDNFFNQFGLMAKLLPALPLIGGGWTRFQPVYVGDVAAAIVKCLADPATDGKTYELGGPSIYTFKELLEYVLEQTGRKRLLMPIPWALAKLQGACFELLPRPLLTRDQVTLLQSDNVVGEDALTLADLGISPTAVEAVVPDYLFAYRRGGQFSRGGPQRGL